MFEYQVQSGPLKITLVAETAYDAAVEAVRWWGYRTARGTAAAHRRALEAELFVRGTAGGNRIQERFSTFNLLAESEGQSAEVAWEQLIDLAIAHRN